MRFLIYLLLGLTAYLDLIRAAPIDAQKIVESTPKTKNGDGNVIGGGGGLDRRGKTLAYYDYIQPEEEFNTSEFTEALEEENSDYISMALDDANDISRTMPHSAGSRKRPSRPSAQHSAASFNSPIYYIRLPPQPYMYVPGLGYISQPPPSPVSHFVNLPVSFVANGKPSTIYQWAGGMGSFPTEPPPVLAPQKPVKVQKPHQKRPLVDSTVHRLPGQYTFNGKPEDIFVLRDSYNSLYSDALQNFYP